MATSTQAQEEPAQPPSANSPPFIDSRNDSVANDESAPLLDADDMAPPPQNASIKLLYIFTITALSSAVLTLILIIAANIALTVGGHHYWLPWGVSESMKSIIAPVSISRTPYCFVQCAHNASGRILPSLLDVQPRRVTQWPWCSSSRGQPAVRYPGGSLCNILRSQWSIRHESRSFDTSEDLSRNSFGHWGHLRVSRPCSCGAS